MRLGRLRAVEYFAQEDGEPVVYRHVFGKPEASPGSPMRPMLRGRHNTLAIDGGRFNVDPNRGICEVHQMESIEVWENPRKRDSKGRFIKKTKKTAKKTKESTSTSSKGERYLVIDVGKKKKKKKTAKKKSSNWTQSQLLAALVGAVVAAFGQDKAQSWMAEKRQQAMAQGTKSWVPDFLFENVEILPAVVGWWLQKKGKKASTRIAAKGLLIAAAAFYAKRKLIDEKQVGASAATAASMVGARGRISDATVQGLGAAAPAISARDAARALGLATGRPPMGMAELRLEAPTPSLTDTATAPTLRRRSGLGYLEPGDDGLGFLTLGGSGLGFLDKDPTGFEGY